MERETSSAFSEDVSDFGSAAVDGTGGGDDHLGQPAGQFHSVDPCAECKGIGGHLAESFAGPGRRLQVHDPGPGKYSVWGKENSSLRCQSRGAQTDPGAGGVAGA